MCEVTDVFIRFQPKLEFPHIFVEVPGITFHENLMSGSLGYICRVADRYYGAQWRFLLFVGTRLKSRECY